MPLFTASDRPVGLSTDWRVGFLGDLHGDLDHLLRVAQTMWAHGISTLIVLGDFGFIWPDGNWDNTIDKISRRLGKLGQVLYFVDGNHEDFTRLYRFPLDADGVRRIRPNIIHLPRGYRTTLVSGKEVAVLGGANSIDRDHRVEGRSWWAEEAITDADLTVLGAETAPLLIGHDAPLHVPALERELAATDRDWSVEALAYAAAGRAVFHRGFLSVQPELYLGGHYHLHIDEQVTYHSEGGEFTCRVVILDMNGTATSQAILDVNTFTLTFLTRDADTVHELSGDEAGVWEITTE
ncbi:MAG: metallophosphoesterase, partial [Kineosporiaceae bacterium]|nr:metallophosphoesterase [Aeromicrobium sp.]